MGNRIAIMVGALALTPVVHATESGPRKALPSQFAQFLSPAQLQSAAPAITPAQLNVLKRFEEDDLRITGYVASRSGVDTPDYRVYVGVRYQSMLGSLAKITSRAFYGSGTYDGINTTGAAAPEDVRMNGALAGNWMGADWNADVALARDLALKVRMRYEDRADAFTPLTPRVELVYRPEQTASVSAIFDQTSGLEIGAERNVLGNTRGRVSYSWQGDALPGAAWPAAAATTLNSADLSGTGFDKRVARMSLEVPILPKRLSSSFELQYIDVTSAIAGEPRSELVIGNLTFASAAISGDTRVTLGMRNLFGAQARSLNPQLLSLAPADGRSVRVDFTRRL